MQAAVFTLPSTPYGGSLSTAAAGVPLIIDPAEPYKVRPMKQADDDPQPDEQPDILQQFRDDGNWQAVSTRTVEKMVDLFIATGEALPEDIALMDLHYWIAKGQVKPFRYYAKRWTWGTKKTRLLFERLGLLGAQQGHKEGTTGAQESKNPEQKETSGAQVGHSEGTSRAQYIKTKIKDLENTSVSVGSAPAREVAMNPFELGNGEPDEQAVKAWAATAGIPPEVAWSIAESMSNIGWVDAKQRKYRRWDVAIKGAWQWRQDQTHKEQARKRTTSNGNGAYQQHPEQPLSLAERTDRELRRTTGKGIGET